MLMLICIVCTATFENKCNVLCNPEVYGFLSYTCGNSTVLHLKMFLLLRIIYLTKSFTYYMSIQKKISVTIFA